MNCVHFEKRKPEPSKIVCVGRNYVEHIHELGNEIPENMVLFNKPNSAIATRLKYFGPECRFEGEICFLVEAGALAGVGFGLDLTRADVQNHLKRQGLPWERAKAFNGSALFSSFVRLEAPLDSLRMELEVNGVVRQHGDVALMIYKPEEILAEIQTFMHLETGDVIMSGTPKGVGGYAVGDRIVGRIYAGERLLTEEVWVANG